MSCALEYRKDFADGRSYASRNVNDLRHTYDAKGVCRSGMDWNLLLRQARKADTSDLRPGKHLKGEDRKAQLSGASSMPEFRSAERAETRRREPLTREHPDGPYQGSTESVGKFGNYGQTQHMLDRGTRVSSGNPLSADWQLNLRDGAHQSPDNKQWRRYFTRPQLSFDLMKAHGELDNEPATTRPKRVGGEHRNAENAPQENPQAIRSLSDAVPQDRRVDRLASAVSHGSVREETISFRRAEGCEGTQVGAWRHLIDDKTRGHKHKRQMAHETTLRCHPGDGNGAKISDNRSDGCIVEMLGKKKWSDTKYERATWEGQNGSRDSTHCRATGQMEDNAGPARPDDGGDAKMHHLHRSRSILPDRDEKDRALRKSKHDRKDADISEIHPGKPRGAAGGGALDGRSDA